MKQILLILSLFVSAAVAHEPYWVQVIAVKKPASLTAGFMSKVDTYSKHHIVIHKNGYSKVLLGFFSHYPQAQSARDYFQKKIAEDAFIVTHPLAKKRDQTPKKTAQAKIDTKKINLTSEKTITQASIAKVQSQAVTEDTNATKKVVMNCASFCNSKKHREDEIASAIAFYKHSKIYKFTNTSNF